MIYAFSEFELDLDTYELRREGRPLPVQPKVFDLLRTLIDRRERVVTKAELLEELWPNEHVSESSIPRTVTQARQLLGQPRGSDVPIETAYGRGYRFRMAVEVRERAAATSFCPPEEGGVLGPFVGRSDVMERLRRAQRQAQAGRGALVLLTGEAGIGKTRCMLELAGEAGGEGPWSVWKAFCAAGDGAPALWPWSQVLRTSLAEDHLDAALRVEGEALLKALTPHAGPDPKPAAELLTPSPGRFQLLDRLARFLVGASRTRPRLLLLDDLHAADEPSVQLLAVLAPALEESPLLVLASLKEGASPTSPSWRRALEPVLRGGQRIQLSALEPPDVERYTAAVTGSRDASALARVMWRKTAGNPFLLQEMLQLVISQQAAGPTQPEFAVQALPEAARELVRSRLEGLGERTLSVLRVASVLGESFELAVLARVLGEGTEDLLAALDRAVDRRLLAVGPAVGAFAFRHGLIRDVLYAEVPGAERAQLHARVGEALEAQPTAASRSSELAFHYYRGLPNGTREKVRQYAELAAAEARRVAAYDEAVRLYGWALEAQAFDPEPDLRKRCEWLVAQGTAQWELGESHVARETLAGAVDLADAQGFADLLALAGISLRQTSHLAKVPDPLALRALESARDRLLPEQVSLRARVLGMLAWIPPHSLDLERSRRLSAESLALAEKSEHPWARFDALRSQFPSSCGPDDVGRLLAIGGEIVALSERCGARLMAVEGYSYRYQALLHRGELAAADVELERYRQAGAELRMPAVQYIHDHVQARKAYYAGCFAEAEARYKEVEQAASGAFGWLDLLFHEVSMAVLRRDRGATGGPLASHLARALPAWVWRFPSARSRVIRTLAESGFLEQVRPEVERLAEEGLDRLPRDQAYLGCLCDLAVVAEILDDRPRAEEIHALLLPYAHFNALHETWFYQGSVSHFLGTLAQLLGRRREAASHLEAAIAMNERIGHVPQLARSRYELARVLAAAGTRGARARAVELRKQAAATARSLGMQSLLCLAERLPVDP